MLAMDVARDDQDLLVVTENGYGKRTLDRRVPQDRRAAPRASRRSADRGEGRARRRARRARAPGARVHLAERDGPAHRGARHQTATAARRRAVRRHERARGRPRVRRRAGGRVRAERRRSPTTAPAARRVRRRRRAGARGRRASSSATPTRTSLLDVPEVEADEMPDPDVEERRTLTPGAGAEPTEGPGRHRGPRELLAGLLAVASCLRRPGGRAPAPTTAAPRCGFR